MFSMGLMAKAAAGKLDGKFRYIFDIYKDGSKVGTTSSLADSEKQAREKISVPPGGWAVLMKTENRI
jgi:hypothetical protein